MYARSVHQFTRLRNAHLHSTSLTDQRFSISQTNPKINKELSKIE
jgi:hypothetical protein